MITLLATGSALAAPILAALAAAPVAAPPPAWLLVAQSPLVYTILVPLLSRAAAFIPTPGVETGKILTGAAGVLSVLSAVALAVASGGHLDVGQVLTGLLAAVAIFASVKLHVEPTPKT